MSERLVPDWMKAWLKSRDNPWLFVTGVLGIVPFGAPNPDGQPQLEKWQDTFLREFMSSPRHSVRSGHSVGKGATIAWLILWFVLTRKDAKGVLTAVSQDQLKDNNWPELRKWAMRLPGELREQVQIDEERIYNRASPELAFITRRTASKSSPEALQGIHAKSVLIIADEASGIDDIVFEIAAGSLATEGAIACLFSNPTRSDGFFFDTHHKLRDRWKCWHVDCRDVPRAQAHIDDVIAAYGQNSNRFRVRVSGDFPTASDETVIPLELVLSAKGRDVETTKFVPVWGVDIARHGDDRCALAKRRGNTLLEPVMWWSGVDLTVSAGKIRRMWEDCPLDDRPSEILIDSIGLGAGVLDMLSEAGLPVRGVNVAETPSASDQYARLRDELWFKGREWFHGRDVKIANDEALIAELTAPTYDFTSNGKIVVEAKKDMKKRGLRSPDLADAFLLTFAGGLDRAIERKPRWHESGGSVSAWAA